VKYLFTVKQINIYFNATRTLIFVYIILFLNKQRVLKYWISWFHGEC